jgi:large conductance mechanosensitive channel
MASLWKDFKEFTMRGNVLDLAVGVIIGAAFGKIVNSLVEDVIMAPLGAVLKGINFQDLYLNLGPTGYPSLAEARKASAPVIAYGNFLNNLLQFLIVAAAVFLIVQAVKRLQSAPPQEQAEEATTKTCPYCISTIALEATRCPSCTSQLGAAGVPIAS